MTAPQLPAAPGAPHLVIDPILDSFADAIGEHLRIYRHHCLYVAHVARALAPESAARHDRALGIAAAFHDLGLFAEGTIDYLEPSVTLAAAYCEREGYADLVPLVTRLIENHHKITRVGSGGRLVSRLGPGGPRTSTSAAGGPGVARTSTSATRGTSGEADLVDAFRRADWQFVMMGAYPGTLGWRAHRQLKRDLPTPGFHRFIVGHSIRHVRSGARNPLPVLRW
ncbi:HD domain-containing protein [Nocardioides salsibiostraticola]